MLQLRLLYLHHLAHISHGQQQRIIISRPIRPVPDYTTLMTKPTFVVAAASLTRLGLELLSCQKGVAHDSRRIQPLKSTYRLYRRWTNHRVMNTSDKKCRKALFIILTIHPSLFLSSFSFPLYKTFQKVPSSIHQ